MIQTQLLACLSWFLVKEQRNVAEEKLPAMSHFDNTQPPFGREFAIRRPIREGIDVLLVEYFEVELYKYARRTCRAVANIL